MQYKPSNFNLFRENNNNLIIYNSLSGGVLELNGELRKEYENFLLYKNKLSDELLENLIKGRMIVDEDDDERDLINAMSKLSRFSNQALGLTIAPTMNCNFACPYCYEEGRRYNSMSDKTISNVVEFINNNMQGRQHLSIAWYGGEPLLGIDSIENITNKLLKNQDKYSYSANMVSNGYLLDRKMAERLHSLKVKSVQITIDGPKEIHDKRRVLRSGKGSFDRILANIQQAYDLLQITIRVNVDKDNVQEVDKLLDCLDKYSLQKKVSLYIAPIDNINDTCNAEKCFTSQEFAQEQMKFYSRNHDRGYFFVKIPTTNPGICGAVSASSFIIDPLGDLYKCWDDIGDTKEKVGNINEPIHYNKNLVKWLNYNCQTDNNCKTCKVLPICMGGCPNRVVKENKLERTCHHIKFTSNEYIDLIKQLHENDFNKKVSAEAQR